MDELNSNSLLTEIDKKIVLRFKKLKGKNKTCVYNLDKFMEQPKVEDFLKKIKKKLGCGGVITEDDDKIPNIEFMGDHRVIIKEILINEKIAPSDKIELKGA
jgi:translation initiation factor 1 (eIF-1/SUI1)